MSQALKETHKKYPNPMLGKPSPNLGKHGKESSGWKGGIKDSNGYILIYSPSHPHVNGGGYVLEHRLVMEAHLGRTLLPTEIVRNINGDPSDNRIENLILFSSLGKHNSFYRKDSKKRSQPREFYDKY